MPLNKLFRREVEEVARMDADYKNSVELALAETVVELGAFNGESWRILKSRLERRREAALKSLIDGDTDEMVLARERVRTIDDLLRVPEDLAQKQAELYASLAELEEEDPWQE